MKKIVYIILSATGIDRLIYQILPDLEAGKHPVAVAGICFFDEHAQLLNDDEPVGRQLKKLADEKEIMLMTAEAKDLEGHLAVSTAGLERARLTPSQCPVVVLKSNEQIACFPDLYAALSPNRPDFMISL